MVCEEGKYLRHRSAKEITDDLDYYQTHEMMNTILGQLLICKEKIDDIMNSSGWDTAFFPVAITLKVKFDEVTVEVCDAWEALEP